MSVCGNSVSLFPNRATWAPQAALAMAGGPAAMGLCELAHLSPLACQVQFFQQMLQYLQGMLGFNSHAANGFWDGQQGCGVGNQQGATGCFDNQFAYGGENQQGVWGSGDSQEAEGWGNQQGAMGFYDTQHAVGSYNQQVAHGVGDQQYSFGNLNYSEINGNGSEGDIHGNSSDLILNGNGLQASLFGDGLHVERRPDGTWSTWRKNGNPEPVYHYQGADGRHYFGQQPIIGVQNGQPVFAPPPQPLCQSNGGQVAASGTQAEHVPVITPENEGTRVSVSGPQAQAGAPDGSRVAVVQSPQSTATASGGGKAGVAQSTQSAATATNGSVATVTQSVNSEATARDHSTAGVNQSIQSRAVAGQAAAAHVDQSIGSTANAVHGGQVDIKGGHNNNDQAYGGKVSDTGDNNRGTVSDPSDSMTVTGKNTHYCLMGKNHEVHVSGNNCEVVTSNMTDGGNMMLNADNVRAYQEDNGKWHYANQDPNDKSPIYEHTWKDSNGRSWVAVDRNEHGWQFNQNDPSYFRSVSHL